jgi:ABC-2 type transport system permease protein
MRRYLALLGIQVRTSLLLAMQYRVDFLVDGALSVLFTVTAMIPLFVVFGRQPELEGWTFGEALVVTGWFTLLQGVMEGAINPSLTAVVEHIRKGTLDFVLLKPADAQFLVSTARFSPWRATAIVNALVVFGYAFHQLGRPPSFVGVLLACAMLVASVAVLYSLWILTVSLAFYVVRVDNLTFLFGSIFDFARWPASVFRGVVAFVFTFVIPLALMTTYPAEAMLGRLEPRTFALSVVGACVFSVVARRVWLRSIARYTSASS